MTIYDIAMKAQVSVATVSRVLNDSRNVSEKTREKVKKIIEKEAYKPNAQARRLSTRNSAMIGVMIPDLENPFFQKLLVNITDNAYNLGYNVVLYNTRENVKLQHKLLQKIMEERLNGLIVIPLLEEDEETKKSLAWLDKNEVPIVLMDRGLSNVRYDRVFSNDFKGAYESVEAFIKAGHKKIGAIAGTLKSTPGRQRHDGFIAALKENDIPINEKYIKFGDFMVNRAYECARELLTQDDRPTAIFCANNLSALGCIKCIYEQNLVIGKDISIISFDEIEEYRFTNINLTVVDRPVVQMARESILLLQHRLDSIKNKKTVDSTRKIIVDTNLILRGSEKMDFNIK